MIIDWFFNFIPFFHDSWTMRSSSSFDLKRFDWGQIDPRSLTIEFDSKMITRVIVQDEIQWWKQWWKMLRTENGKQKWSVHRIGGTDLRSSDDQSLIFRCAKNSRK